MSRVSGTNSKQREPPPALFLHPSPAASHVSLPGILASGVAASVANSAQRERSTLEVPQATRPTVTHTNEARRAGRLRSGNGTRSADRTDALWAEMQATLEEVELSASGGTHVFGPEHDGKLAELRASQIALAQAWARSEADDAIETTSRDNGLPVPAADEVRNLKGALNDAGKAGLNEGADAVKSSSRTTSARGEGSAGGVDKLGAKLEEETEVDILLARKRREANDEYFRCVNRGVLEVVAKLEDVAVAMRAVEQESTDVWSEAGNTRGM